MIKKVDQDNHKKKTSSPEQEGSFIPNAPKGTKISHRMKGLFTIGGITLLLLMGYFVNHNGQSTQQRSSSSSTVTSDDEQTVNSEGMIDQINRQPDNVPGLLQGTSAPTEKAVLRPTTTSSKPIDHHEVDQSTQEALKSGLGVRLNQMAQGEGSMDTYHQQDNESENNISSTSATASQNPYASQNMQHEKTAFLQRSTQHHSDYLQSSLQQPLSAYEVQAGSIIPAELITGIDSDLPGQITALVRQNVYDTVTGNYLLIPQGSKLVGAYDSQIAYGQRRVLIAWSRVIFPNGDSMNLQGMPGVDLAGMSGLHDVVDNHYFRIFGSALLFSLFGAMAQLSQPQQSTTNGALTNQQIMAASVGQQFSQTGAQMTQKNLNIQPTINIRQGDLFNVFVTKDMVFPGPYQG